MEKRALIAFVLSLAVLVFWEMYFGLVRTPPTDTTHEQTQATAPAPEPSPAAPPLKSLLPEALPKDHLTTTSSGTFERWLVNTSLYDMQVASPGARIDAFQLNQYRQQVNPDSPAMDMVTTKTSGYLPMAVDLLNHSDWELATRSYVSDAPKTVNVNSADLSRQLSFFTTVPEKVNLTKSFNMIPGSYVVDATIEIENLSDDRLHDQLGVSFYFQPYAAGETSYNISQLSLLKNGTLEYFQTKDILKKNPVFEPPVDWIGYENNYFIQAIVPLETGGYKIVPRVLDENKHLLQLVYLTDPFELAKGERKTFNIRLYMGPKEVETLQLAGHDLNRAVDFGWFTFLAKPLLLVLRWFYKYTHNYGVAIILLTVVIKILFWPLTHKSYKSMQVMKKIQPKIAQVREKYKDDREKLNQELMMLYRTYKVNPLGGCLPMVLQIPVFFALYRMLYGALELRHKPFVLWINDLTAPDRLHIGIDIPYLGGIPVLTLLMGASMFIQQKMMPTGGDPRQEKMMLLMPVIFTVFFVNFPSGLVLYWLVNNVLSIVQQYWINRQA